MTDISAPVAAVEVCEAFDRLLPGVSPTTSALVAKTDDELGWMPLAQHLADAACIGSELWTSWLADRLRRRIAHLTELSMEQCAALVSFLCGAHDIGKASPFFASRLTYSEAGRQGVDELASAGFPLGCSLTTKDAEIPHGAASQAILKRWLRQRGCSRLAALSLGSVVGAHHGVAVTSDRWELNDDAVFGLDETWHRSHEELLDLLAWATGFDAVIPELSPDLFAPVLQLLSGVVVMADWIASNAEAFPYIKSGTMIQRVADGMDQVDLTPPWQVPDVEITDPDEFYRSTFGWGSERTARPIQSAALSLIRLRRGPQLIVIEAPTGEGKTETAAAIAQILVSRNRDQGVIFAAPTMATSDGLFGRIVDWAGRNTPDGAFSSMSLLHSKAALSKPLAELRFSGVSGENGGVVASQWLSGPKKATLSNFVVATVDQVLMLALQSRHSMLRHLGLAGKVVVIDECHSYDIFMSSYLETALQWLARYGASVVLLSATLPIEQKQRLVAAYAGEYLVEPPALGGGYPLITAVGADGVEELAVAPGPTDLDAQLTVLDDDVEVAVVVLGELLADGGVALVICNTVARAQGLYRSLAAVFPEECELHHAAFIASDRVEKEARLRHELGPTAHRGAGRPWRRIIVATQVAEQSLDIDADVLVTDIAPMDLLIQRIGRIHRHQRPDSDRPQRLQEPQVFIRGIAERGASLRFDPGSAAVYGEWILLNTYAELPARFRRPDDIEALVAATYTVPDPIPAAWMSAHAEWLAARAEAVNRAETYRIPAVGDAVYLHELFKRYHKDLDRGTTADEAGYAQVRDAEPTIEVIPIRGAADCYQPVGRNTSVDGEWILGDPELDRRTAFALAGATVRLPPRLYRGKQAFEDLVDFLERSTPLAWGRSFLLKGMVALPLDENLEVSVGKARLRYSDEFGLEQVDAHVGGVSEVREDM